MIVSKSVDFCFEDKNEANILFDAFDGGSVLLSLWAPEGVDLNEVDLEIELIPKDNKVPSSKPAKDASPVEEVEAALNHNILNLGQ